LCSPTKPTVLWLFMRTQNTHSIDAYTVPE
jgi:hypothetical protein